MWLFVGVCGWSCGLAYLFCCLCSFVYSCLYVFDSAELVLWLPLIDLAICFRCRYFCWSSVYLYYSFLTFTVLSVVVCFYLCGDCWCCNVLSWFNVLCVVYSVRLYCSCVPLCVPFVRDMFVSFLWFIHVICVVLWILWLPPCTCLFILSAYLSLNIQPCW